jgi:hypothetical protein
MYEHHSQPLLPRRLFLRRLLKHIVAAAAFLSVGLAIGVLGYHLFEHLSWLDSLLNASMILGGMGPVSELQTRAGKVFASLYAIFSGIFFLLVAGIVIAPIFHRILHRLHLDADIQEDDSDGGSKE